MISHQKPVATALASLAAFSFLSGCGKAPVKVRADLPQNFTAQASISPIETNITFKDSEGPFAYVGQRSLSVTKCFEYFDAKHSLQAKAKQKAFSFGTKIDITDADGRAIGSVEENVLKSLLRIKTSYTIKNAKGEVLAESQKLDLGRTSIEIKNAKGDVIATMKRPLVDLGAATWDIHIAKDPGVDKRLLVFIPSFKTATDRARSSSTSKSSSKK